VDSNQQKTRITSHPEINVKNIDIIETAYNQEGAQAKVRLHVRGTIENRGRIIDLAPVEDGKAFLLELRTGCTLFLRIVFVQYLLTKTLLYFFSFFRG